jgi:hypothetical protein
MPTPKITGLFAVFLHAGLMCPALLSGSAQAAAYDDPYVYHDPYPTQPLTPHAEYPKGQLPEAAPLRAIYMPNGAYGDPYVYRDPGMKVADAAPVPMMGEAPMPQVQAPDDAYNNYPPTVLIQAPTSDTPPATAEQQIVYHQPGGEPQDPELMSLATRPGFDIGAQVSDYRYHEPSPGTKIQGPHFGGTLDATGVVGDHYFGIAEFRGVTGPVDYSGNSGSKHDQTNTLFEGRGLFGKDFIFSYFSFSPYVGVGYRYVDNDLSGNASNGTPLYERENGNWYIPIGFMPRMYIDESSRLAALFEYDVVVQGRETSHLGDAHAGDPEVHDEQDNGFGFRSELMYETKYWSFGPFASYWAMNTSRFSIYHSPSSSCGSTTCSLTVPYNHTIEAGLQFKVHI